MEFHRWREIRDGKMADARHAQGDRRVADRRVTDRRVGADRRARAELQNQEPADVMEKILRHRGELGDEMPGLTIVPSERPCETCGTYERRITWADYDAGRVHLPPLHAGCMCTVRPWIRSPGAA